ncbi:MAG: hypothetical protein RL220_827 [Bacteroidota bacterium]
MKRILTLILAVSLSGFALGQAAFVLPSPTNANDSLTIYIDLNQSVNGTQNNALKAHLQGHPEYQDSVYLWSWAPAGPVCGNGEWNNSNECMKLTRVNGLLYSIKIKPLDFYGVTALQLFQNGISCLAKLDDGKQFEDEGIGESKSEDFHIDIVPALCEEKFCFFPEAAKLDDFLSITYDNNQEAVAELQNMGTSDCYIYLSAKTGPFTSYPIAPQAEVVNHPELQMKPVPGSDGLFRITFIPSDLFTAVPADEEIETIIYYVIRPGYLYPGQPPNLVYVPLNCE